MRRIERRSDSLVLLATAIVLWASLIGAACAETAVSRIDAALQNITALSRPGRVGYATVWDGNRYVQCRRLQNRDLWCEAAGTLLQPSLESILAPPRLARLHALGWRLDGSFGNYTRDLQADMPTSTMASTVLQVLVEAYDVKPDAVEIETRWVADMPCPPRNGPGQNLAGMVNDSREMRATALLSCSYTPDPDLVGDMPVTSAQDLLARYGTRLTTEIQRLRINQNRRVHTVFGAGIGYIQCMPDPTGRAIYCEAQSERSWPALTAILTAERVSRLRAAGYADPGRSPNYWKSYPMADVDDAAIAAETLTLLYEVYGYRGTTKLKVSTE